jgi:5'(3')-deoxyribonucleotidase
MIEKMKQPVILLDCDGVIADFVHTALKFTESRTGKKYTPSDVSKWDIFESLGHPELWNQFNLFCEVEGTCLDILPYPESLDPVAALKSKYDVVIVTSPVDAKPWMHERAVWLKQHFNIERKKVIFANEKHHVMGDVLIDDKPSNIIGWCEANPHGLGILWDQPYNRAELSLPSNSTRLSTWESVVSHITSRFR